MGGTDEVRSDDLGLPLDPDPGSILIHMNLRVEDHWNRTEPDGSHRYSWFCLGRPRSTGSLTLRSGVGLLGPPNETTESTTICPSSDKKINLFLNTRVVLTIPNLVPEGRVPPGFIGLSFVLSDGQCP